MYFYLCEWSSQLPLGGHGKKCAFLPIHSGGLRSYWRNFPHERNGLWHQALQSSLQRSGSLGGHTECPYCFILWCLNTMWHSSLQECGSTWIPAVLAHYTDCPECYHLLTVVNSVLEHVHRIQALQNDIIMRTEPSWETVLSGKHLLEHCIQPQKWSVLGCQETFQGFLPR